MYDVINKTRLFQGDILEGLSYEIPKLSEGKIIRITPPYSVVLSQDCDLELDYNHRNDPNKNNDKYLQTVLISPAYLSDEFKLGKHMEAIGLKMNEWGGSLWDYIITNQNDRFHYLKEDLVLKLPSIVIDFKHYYTIPIEQIYSTYQKNYKISIKALFREDLSLRFTNYLSRIGLPENLPT